MNTELIPQLWSSACFLAAGMIGALMSDLLFACTVPNRPMIRFFSDFILMVFCALLLFLTSVSVVQDTLRGYMLVMFLLGGILWERTAGRAVRWLLCAVFQLCARLFRAAVWLFHKPQVWIKQHRPSRSQEKNRKKNKKAGKSTSIFFANRLK